MVCGEQLAVQRIIDNLCANSFHLVPDDDMISDFLIRAVEHILRMISLRFGEKVQ